MGKQVNGLKPSHLPHAFGRESKEGYNLNPSLSQQFLFDHEQALGKQLTSRRPTQPRFHMGTSNRACDIPSSPPFLLPPWTLSPTVSCTLLDVILYTSLKQAVP